MDNFYIISNEDFICADASDFSLVVDNEITTNIIIDEFVGKNIKLEINSGANVNLLFFTKENSDSVFDVTINENASLNLDLILMNNNTKSNLDFNLIGEYADLNVNILSLAKDSLKDFNVNVNHLAHETKSSVSNYGISFENGKNHFNINGVIKPNMKNSDVKQITRGLILSPSGECIANPILLIDYYDVKAYHGATIGKVSDDDLFYLMSRGLSKEESFMLIINGILDPFIKKIKDVTLKEKIMETYNTYFQGE